MQDINPINIPVDIHAAVEQQNVEAVKHFIEKQPNLINTLDPDGNTPLHIAAKNGNCEIVQLLINAGAPIDAKNNQDFTPLLLSVSNNKFEAVQLLVTHEANVNCYLTHETFKGMSALHCAIKTCNPEMVQYLISKNADVNINPEGGRFTPIMFAAVNNQRLEASDSKEKIIQCLLDAGADIEQPNFFGTTLIDLLPKVYKKYKAYQDRLLAIKNTINAAALEEKSKTTSTENVTLNTTDVNAVTITATHVNVLGAAIVTTSETTSMDYEYISTTEDDTSDIINNNAVTQTHPMDSEPTPVTNRLLETTAITTTAFQNNFSQWANMFQPAVTTTSMVLSAPMNETQKEEQEKDRNSSIPTPF